MLSKTSLAIALTLLTSHIASAQIRLDVRGGATGFSRSVSVTNENGVKTTQMIENGEKYIVRESDAGIEVEFAQAYGPNDLDKLKEKHPDLHMHVTSFPKTTGNSAVELTVSVKEKVSAKDESELKEKSPEAFAVFKKCTGKEGVVGGLRIIEADGVDFGKIELELAKPLVPKEDKE